MRNFFWIPVFAFLAFASCSTQHLYPGIRPTRESEWAKSSNWVGRFSVEHNVPYADSLGGDFYTPVGLGPFPTVLLVHGGGWDSGTRTQTTPIAEKLAGNGFAVYNVEYRLAPKNRYPAPVDDLVTATRWLRAHATERKIDPARIGAYGYSAGAHLVSMLALTDHGSDARITAVVSGGTPAVLTRFTDSPLVKKLLGKTYAEDPALYAEASPIHHVATSQRKIPFFLYHAKGDWIVPHNQMESFRDALIAHGYPVETYEVPIIGHIELFLFGENAVDRAIEFLKKTL